MQEVEGINLAQVAAEAEAQALDQKRVQIRQLIGRIACERDAAIKDRKELEKQLAKLNKRIERATNRLKSLRSGDWNALDEREVERQEAAGGGASGASGGGVGGDA